MQSVKEIPNTSYQKTAIQTLYLHQITTFMSKVVDVLELMSTSLERNLALDRSM